MYSKSRLFIARITLFGALLLFTLWSVLPMNMLFSEVGTELVEKTMEDSEDSESENKEEKSEEYTEKGFIVSGLSSLKASNILDFGKVSPYLTFYEFSFINSFYSPPELHC